MAMWQMPVQQSAGLKHRSPSDAHAAPDDAHNPPAQLPEQQSALVAHLLPKLVQVAVEPAITAQVEPMQFWVQQSLLPAHEAPVALHRPAPHEPVGQLPLQQSVAWVQVAPTTPQAPPVRAQV
jgi:hypothetical protein